MNIKHEIIIVIICTLCYGHTWKGNFVFDDTEAIVNNKDLNLDTPLSNILKNDFWGTNIKSNISHKSYRPVTVFVFRCIVEIAGAKEPVWFHITNIILYIIICLQCYNYLQLWLDRSLSFYTSILFTVHPVHTEVIASAVGCADLLCGVFFFLGMDHFHKSVLNKQLWRFIGSLLFITIATFCKEIGIMSVGVFLLLDLLITVNNKAPRLNRLFYIRTLGLLCTGIVLLYVRCQVMNFTTPVFQEADNPASFSNSLLTKFLTYSYIYALNEIILLWPEWLCFDWSMGCIPLLQQASDPRTIIVLLFWTITLLYLYKSISQKNNTIFFALTIIGITFLPASNILFRVGFVIAERILFLPSFGHSLLVIYGWKKIFNRYPKYKSQLTYIFWLTVLFFGLKTHFRASDWLNEYNLFNSALNVCPKNAKVHYNVAKISADLGNFSFAENEYRLALELYPNYDQTMNNLANILRDRGQFEEAKSLLLKAVSLRSDFAAAWMNLGIVLATLGDDEESEIAYKEALKHRKNYSDCYYNLGNLYLKQNRHREALESWKTATEINPSHSAAWSNILVLFDNLGQHDSVIEVAKLALEHCPNTPAIHFTTANTLGKLERWTEAEKHFKLAIQLKPNNALYYSNFGVLYHRWGDLEKAREMYKKALKLNPQMTTAAKNLNRIS